MRSWLQAQPCSPQLPTGCRVSGEEVAGCRVSGAPSAAPLRCAAVSQLLSLAVAQEQNACVSDVLLDGPVCFAHASLNSWQRRSHGCGAAGRSTRTPRQRTCTGFSSTYPAVPHRGSKRTPRQRTCTGFSSTYPAVSHRGSKRTPRQRTCASCHRCGRRR